MTKSAKKRVNVQELYERHLANCERIQAIADTCDTENRERNETEQADYERLTRENQVIMMRIQAAQAAPTVAVKTVNEQFRENMTNKVSTTFVFVRDIQGTEVMEGTGIIPIAQQSLLKPLREGLIWDKLGIQVQSGLRGKLRWPKHSKARAQWADEKEKLVDSSISYDKLEMAGHRLGIAISATREEIYDSEGVAESVINEEMPAACIDEINGQVLNPNATGKVKGPFAQDGVKARAIVFAGDVPTRKELLKMKTEVAKTGVKLSAPCWVMTESMKAELEDTKVDAGSGRFVCENNMILGYPVFTSSAIGEGYVGFGDWSYQAAGFFGQTDLVVDPYTLAREHATDFVLNLRFGTATLYEEAFCLGKTKTADTQAAARTATAASED